MATKAENLGRVGAGIQMGAMVAMMADANRTGWDDKLGQIAEKIGRGCMRAASGNLANAADIIDAAAAELASLADEMRSEKK